jgi:hypothetical protein
MSKTYASPITRGTPRVSAAGLVSDSRARRIFGDRSRKLDYGRRPVDHRDRHFDALSEAAEFVGVDERSLKTETPQRRVGGLGQSWLRERERRAAERRELGMN